MKVEADGFCDLYFVVGFLFPWLGLFGGIALMLPRSDFSSWERITGIAIPHVIPTLCAVFFLFIPGDSGIRTFISWRLLLFLVNCVLIGAGVLFFAHMP